MFHSGSPQTCELAGTDTTLILLAVGTSAGARLTGNIGGRRVVRVGLEPSSSKG